MESDTLIKDTEFDKINSIYDECIQYLETIKETDCDEDQLLIQNNTLEDEYGAVDPTYEIIKESIKLKTIQSNNNVNEDPKYESIKTPKEIKKIQNNIHNGPKFESKKASSETEIILNDINKKEDPKYETIKTPSTIKSKQNNKNDPEYEKIKAPIETKTKQNNTNNKEIEDKALKEGNKQNKVNFANDENENLQTEITEAKNVMVKSPVIKFKVENELAPNETQIPTESRSERLRRLSKQLPRIVITQSNSSLNKHKEDCQSRKGSQYSMYHQERKKSIRLTNIYRSPPPSRTRAPYGDFPKRLVSKSGMENVALISNVPYEKIRLLNDTFHTLINLRWRWIVIGTIVVHFAIWLIFAVFWYITALAHYDFEPDPPKRGCITGGTDFVTIFLASVEAQTTIGFGDRAIDEECPESIFLFIMQLILGTGLSGVLTCVVYAKLTRPEKLSRDGVGFSKKAVICMRDGHLCLMMRAWDLNYDHIISSEFSAHFVNTHKTKEGEIIRYYARSLMLQQRQFLLWPVTLVHVIDVTSPLYKYTPEQIANNSYEITVSLKGASASMGTFTQSQTSYMPREIIWGHRFPPVVKYDSRKQKYVIDHKKLDTLEPVDTPYCSADELYNSIKEDKNNEDLSSPCPGTPSSFSEKISAFVLERTSSFRRNNHRS